MEVNRRRTDQWHYTDAPWLLSSAGARQVTWRPIGTCALTPRLKNDVHYGNEARAEERGGGWRGVALSLQGLRGRRQENEGITLDLL